MEFSVEDFVPEKLKVELTPDEPITRPGSVNRFVLSADFLYGAPASDLAVAGDRRITVDDNPFPAFAKYRIGPEDDREKFEPPFIELKGESTDPAGKSSLEWAGDLAKETVLPLRAQIQARHSGKTAIESLGDFVDRHPNASEARLTLARLLIAEKNIFHDG